MTITPKNWGTFQHYKTRRPAWIKLHHGLLDDFSFSRLPIASKALAPLLWLLASEYPDGKITAKMDELTFRLHMTPADIISALTPLIDSGFFDASEPLAVCYPDASPRREENKIEVEKRREDISRATPHAKCPNHHVKRKRSHLRAQEGALLSDDWPADYEIRFWNFWPNKVGKPAALKALASARKRRCSFVVIMTGIADYTRDKPPDRPWLNPATFLNQNRWEDQPATVSTGNGKHGKRTVHDAADDLLRHVRALEEAEADRQQFDSQGENAVRKLSTH